MDAAGFDPPVRHDRALYEGPASRVIGVVRDLGDHEAETILLTGHEPTWSGAVSQLIGGGEVHMVTAAVACVHCPVGRWSQVREGSGRLLFMLPPKLLLQLV